MATLLSLESKGICWLYEVYENNCAPRISDTPVEPEPFAAKILKPYQKRSQKLAELFPKLFVEGLTRDFEPALRCLLGKSAASSPATAVLDQAKEKEKPVDKMSKNETDAVAIAA